MIEASGVKGGLVVYIGDAETEFLAGLRVNDSYLVQGLIVERRLRETRDAIAERGLTGKVTVDKLDNPILPYVDNLVNLLIDESETLGIKREEILRVLAPGGVAIVDGEKIVKPVPANTDDWTHHMYDSTGVNAGNDRAVGPPRHLQWKAGPAYGRSHENISSVSVAVSAGGRVFSIIDEGPTASIYLPAQWTLSARDAFSGVRLWERPINSWHAQLFPLKNAGAALQMPRRLVAAGGPLASSGQAYIYVTLGLDAPASKIDAATGEILATYSDTAHAEELLFVDGKLIALCSNAGNTVPYRGVKPVGRSEFDTNEKIPRTSSERSVVVVDTEQDKTLWKVDCGGVASLSLVADEEVVSFLTTKDVRCLDMKSGDMLWRKNVAAAGPLEELSGAPTVLMHKGVLYVGQRRTMRAIDVKDGNELWVGQWTMGGFRAPASIFIFNDLIWNVDTSGEIYRTGGKWKKGDVNRHYTGHDLRTGEVRRTIPVRAESGYANMHHRCHVPRASGNYILTAFPGIEFFGSSG